jgi:hypothetical protein
VDHDLGVLVQGAFQRLGHPLEDAQQGLFVLHGAWVFHVEGRVKA